MPKLTTLAPAKINLTFDILGTMPDGFHQVETILQSVDLADRLVFDIEEAAATSVEIRSAASPRLFPQDDTNLIAKAAREFSSTTNRHYQIVVDVEKSIPIGAGLAGGSTNAAATLAALNKASNSSCNEELLLSMAKNIGADVPFCLAGGTKFGTNRGDVLSPIDSTLSFTLCIVKPADISVSTPWAYGQFDTFDKQIPRPKTQEAIAALKHGALEHALSSFGNVFEPVIFSQHNFLSEIKDHLKREGAWYVQLSGSGPSLFAIVPDLEHAHFLRRKIRAINPNLEFYFCQTTKTGVSITEYEHGKATC